MKYYVRLTDKEYNAISRFTRQSHMDEVVDISTHVERGDYFYDYDENRIIPFEEGLQCMIDNIYVKGVAYAYEDKEHRNIILEIMENYSIDDRKKEYVRQVNEELDKQIKM